MKRKHFLLPLAVSFGFFMHPGFAEETTSTLKKIESACAQGANNCLISLGVRDASIPFSYKLNNDQYVGYSYEIAQRIIQEIRTKLKLPALKVKDIPITSQNRIPLLQNGTIDIECGSTTNNIERQKQAAFTNSIFVIGTRLLTAKNSKINDFDDLRGKTVVTTAGTTSERILKKMNADKNMNMDIVSAKDHGQADLMLKSHRAAAFMMDDALLYGERAKAKDKDKWVIVGTPQSFEAYGCMIRKDDPEFKKLADGVIAKLMRDGTAHKLYEKWFMQPIPPSNITLDFPLSEAMEDLFKHPNDRAFQ